MNTDMIPNKGLYLAHLAFSVWHQQNFLESAKIVLAAVFHLGRITLHFLQCAQIFGDCIIFIILNVLPIAHFDWRRLEVLPNTTTVGKHL